MEVLGSEWKHPVACASGVLGSNAPGMMTAASMGASAVFTKTVTPDPRPGHPGPCYVDLVDEEGYAMNAMGLPNPGPDIMTEEVSSFRKMYPEVPVYCSVSAEDPEGFARVASTLSEVSDGIEINVSCPHAGAGMGAELGSDPDAVEDVVSAVASSVNVPVSVKLTPNVDRKTLLEVAERAVDAGADALTAVNTLGPGLRIDPVTRSPVLGAGVGGVSGPTLKPVALRVVADVALYLGDDVEIVGVGGVSSGRDVVEFLMAGARAVQMGTAARDRTFHDVALEAEHLLEKLELTWEEAVGAALDSYERALRRLGWA